jgi:integrase
VRWCAVMWLPGRKRRVVSCKTEGQALDAEAQMRVDRRAGKLVASSALTVAQWLDVWIDEEASHRLGPTTLRRYRGICDRYLKPDLGGRRLDRLTALDITKARNRWLAGKPATKADRGRRALAPRSVQQHLAVLHKALSDAVRLGVIPFNPADAVERPRADYFDPAVLDAEGARTMIDKARATELFAPVLLALSTGMRRGEILALRWSDVDLKAGTVNVRRSAYQSDGGGRAEKEPKSRSGRRQVPLPAFAAEELRKVSLDQKARHMAHPELGYGSPLVCQQADVGGPLEVGTFSSHFKRFATANGFTGTRFHDLRHTFATLNMAAGANPAAVGLMLGHSSAAFTMRQYVHAQAAEQDRLAERMDGLLRSRTESDSRQSDA